MSDFDWDEFLELAEELARRRGDDAALRSAISRAYYAAYHRASEYTMSRGERLTFTAADHRSVWAWFRRPDAGALSREIADAGIRLRQARREADYDRAVNPDLTANAPRFVSLARRVVTELHRL